MKTIVVMSGGGAKGCFEVGVLKYLDEQKVKIDGAYGTSVGALNAAGYASGGAARLEFIWKQINKRSDILSFNFWRILATPFSFIPWIGKPFKKFAAKGLYSTKPLRKLIDTFCTAPWQCEAVACKVSLITGEIAYGRSGEANFHESVEASAAIPGIMEPIGDGWADGGVREQTPLNQVFKDHPDVDRIIVILCNPYRDAMEPGKEPFKVGNLFTNALRAIDIMEHETFINDIESCIKKNDKPGYKHVDLEVYCPDKLVIDTLQFEPAAIRAGLNQGYFTALAGPFIKV